MNVQTDSGLTYGGYLQQLHDFCSAFVVRHQRSQAWLRLGHNLQVLLKFQISLGSGPGPCAPGFLSLPVITISHLSDSEADLKS